VHIPRLLHSFHSVPAVRGLTISAATIVFLISTGCGSSNWSAQQKPAQTSTPPPVVNTPSPTGSSTTPPVLLFDGSGTSSSDVTAIETVLNNMGLKFATANSAQLDAMSQAQLNTYKLFLVPGGNSITIGNNLTHTATTNVHNAVVNGGLHYLGICAGGFFGGYSMYNGLDLTSGVWFNFYADYNNGVHKEAVEIAAPGGSKLDQYWENGPQFTGWGSIVGKYPDGTPAIVEGKSGNGWVVLAGVHPEAPASWRYGMTFTTSVATDNAYAVTLINAALNGTSLSHF